MAFEIKKVLSKDDCALIEKLAKTIWKEYYIKILTNEQIDYMTDKFQSESAVFNQISNEGYEYYILYDNHPVGYIGIKKEERRLFLSKFYILKEERNKGYARLAFNFINEYSLTHNLKSIYLTVNKENESSIGIYNHFGFKVIKEQKADIGRGFFMDDFIMEKELTF